MIVAFSGYRGRLAVSRTAWPVPMVAVQDGDMRLPANRLARVRTLEHSFS